MTNAKPPLHIVIHKVREDLQALPMPERVLFLSRAARVAAQESARLAGLALPDFPKSGQGAPLPCGEVYWSLTHKPQYVGGVAGLASVGLDLEMKRPLAMKIYDRVATNKEWQLAINAGLDSRTAFFMFWTAKEALLKRTGLGLSQGLSSCVVEEVRGENEALLLSLARQYYEVRYFAFDGHLAAVCADDAEICWHLE